MCATEKSDRRELVLNCYSRGCEDCSLYVSNTEQLYSVVARHCRDHMDPCIVQQLQLGSSQMTLNFE